MKTQPNSTFRQYGQRRQFFRISQCIGSVLFVLALGVAQSASAQNAEFGTSDIVPCIQPNDRGGERMRTSSSDWLPSQDSCGKPQESTNDSQSSSDSLLPRSEEIRSNQYSGGILDTPTDSNSMQRLPPPQSSDSRGMLNETGADTRFRRTLPPDDDFRSLRERKSID